MACLALIAACVPALQTSAPCQQAGADPGAAADLEHRLNQLADKMTALQEQLSQSRSEVDALKAELKTVRAQMVEKSQSDDASQTAAALRASVDQLKEEDAVLQAEVQQHDQTKVESASKYPLRISGMMLFTAQLNDGNPDDIDLPVVALPNQSNGSIGSLSATLRQTILGLDASGPHLWGAQSSADINVDFFGTIPYGDYSATAGSLRMRTAHATLEWPHRTLSFALDRPLLTPWQPTSWVSVGEPPLSWAGNLWAWSPQLEYSDDSFIANRHLKLQLGLIDPSAPGSGSPNGLRQPNAPEQSRQPGYEARIGASLAWQGHPFNFGAGGYYDRQTYNYDAHVDAWTGTADWNVFLAPFVQLSGEFYRGRAISGLGGGAFKDYATYDSYAFLRGLDAVGGWTQLKLLLSRAFEVNLAGGQDGDYPGELRNSDLLTASSSYSNLIRNQSVYGNFVYRPRSYLLFSTEFRQLQSWPIAGASNRDRMVGLAAGYSF
jgi:hypothetical protein